MIRLYAVNILPLQDEACFENCCRRSAKERREKADSLQMPGDKARCIAAGLLLEYAYKKFRIETIKELANANSFGYAQNAGVSDILPEKMPEIGTGMRGKPEFVWPENWEREIYFNLSHSGDYVICAMADFEVGADIQVKTRVRESLLRRFFLAEERRCVEMGEDNETMRERVFARIWASKEAETKLTGRGIGQLLEKAAENRGTENAVPSGEGEKEDAVRVWQGMIEEDYAWAIAGYLEETEDEPKVLEPIMVDEGELFYEGMF